MGTNAKRRIPARTIGWVVGAAMLAAMTAGWAVFARPAAGTAALPAPVSVSARAQDGVRVFTIVARRYSYSPDRIEVREGDVVKITLEAADIAHSFTIDDPYRISKRATPGRPVVFEFRADRAGSFTFYCNLTTDGRCRDMKGTLVVDPR